MTVGGRVQSGMNTRHVLSAALMSVVMVAAACEEKAPPPSAGSSNNQPLGNMRDTPTSIPGKSAAMGKDAARGIQGAQDAAANAANQITGQSGAEMVVGGLKFPIPSDWKSVTPSSSMTKATYMIPGAGNAQCNFSTAGGDVASNLNRWRTQITDASGQQVEGETTEHTVAGIPVTIFKATGTYATMSGAKQPNTAFRGAIIKAPAGLVFVRLTGAAATIGPADGQFEQTVLGFTK